MDTGKDIRIRMTRRDFVKTSSALAVMATLGEALVEHSQVALAQTSDNGEGPRVQTVLGPISPDDLGVTLMHEHAPVIDWSELYGHPIAPIEGAFRQQVIDQAASGLQAFHNQLDGWAKSGTIVEVTPIRVGRYPDLIVDMARKARSTSSVAPGSGARRWRPCTCGRRHAGAAQRHRAGHAALREEITEGDGRPVRRARRRLHGRQGGHHQDRHQHLSDRPWSGAPIRQRGWPALETGCPISVHTTDGGGLEMAQLLLSLGVSPQKIIIGHQGYKDDRENVRATDYHKQLGDLGVWVQFDRIGYPNYPVEDRAEYIRPLLDAGYEDQLLLSTRHRSLFLPDVLAGGEARVGWCCSRRTRGR